MTWLELANDMWTTVKPLAVAAVALALVFVAVKQAQWTDARRKLARRETLNDAATDAVASVDREFVQPLKDPETPGAFDAAAADTARTMATARVVASEPDTMRELVREGVDTATMLAGKIDRAVAIMRAAGVPLAPDPPPVMALRPPPLAPPGVRETPDEGITPRETPSSKLRGES